MQYVCVVMLSSGPFLAFQCCACCIDSWGWAWGQMRLYLFVSAGNFVWIKLEDLTSIKNDFVVVSVHWCYGLCLSTKQTLIIQYYMTTLQTIQ